MDLTSVLYPTRAANKSLFSSVHSSFYWMMQQQPKWHHKAERQILRKDLWKLLFTISISFWSHLLISWGVKNQQKTFLQPPRALISITKQRQTNQHNILQYSKGVHVHMHGRSHVSRRDDEWHRKRGRCHHKYAALQFSWQTYSAGFQPCRLKSRL